MSNLASACNPPFGRLARSGSCALSFASRGIALIERWLTPAFDLAIRLYVASVFFKSGLTKIQDWGSTVALFQYEYHVPVLPPELAAFMGAAGELGLPVLLAFGLAGRFGAAGLSVMNVVAVISYADISDLGRQDHVLWGALLLVTLLHGPGRWSLDHWFRARWASIRG
ncbi:MAG: DoxX family protein [Propionivibrio sp.]|uniref:DoxX family protein n=1 Tax=Propionivibrio sp. TaxID=2212460 RepID=UPI0025E9983B|nr:DoxX family protein [Propionivibrio sp.]MBK8894795.1 DoxX family protein [Propionivibrio sp.]